MPGRKYSSGSQYRYGFQNQETDNELWGGAIAFEYRVEDPRLVRFFSVDPLASQYSYNSPYAFGENRLIDGVELEGLEWKPTKDKQGSVTGYTWSGYNRDGSPVEGTASGGIVYNKAKGYNAWYTSDQATRSGSVDFMSAGSKEYQKHNESPSPTTQNKFNVTINYKDNWTTVSSLFGTYRKEVTVDAELWNENGSAKTGATTYNNNMGVSPEVYNNPKRFFNSFRYSLGYADGPTSGALIPVYPESLLLPLPKGLNLLGKLGTRIGELEIPVYRVFGGSSRVYGESWTFINPRLYGGFYRNLAGLPRWNSGSFMVKGTVKLSEINSFRMALPLHGNIGRFAPELIIKQAESKVLLKSFRGTNF